MSELIEYWQFLLIPVFFGLGWAAARVDMRQVVHESRAMPRSYFQGLNFLLNEQTDRAIEAFVDAVKVDPQTVELHFALGSLFRRRGETERAIRMHQSLVERDDLPQELKLQAMAALGQDFLKAGLLDRAEAVFEKLRVSPLAEEAKRKTEARERACLLWAEAYPSTGHAYLSGSQMQLVFPSEKLMELLSGIGAKIASLQPLTASLEKYKSIAIGFNFSK